jgi:valyl-tRNA synthetase
VVDMVTSIRSVRAEMNVPAGAQLPATVKGPSAATKQRLATHGALICANARLLSITASEAATPGAAQVVIGEATVSLSLEGVVDLSKERDRLTKEIAKLDVEIAGIVKKMSNESFVLKAPAEVVDKNRERQAAKESERTKLSEALTRISAA